MGYESLVDWMFKLERFGIKLGLRNMTEFLSRVGDPHVGLRTVHVSGTNGKGSVCAFLASALREAGYGVGLYTSPHLVDFRERILVDGEHIREDDVVRIGNELRSTMEGMAAEDPEKQLTFFELTTGMALRYFRERDVDIAVVEVGMGGRLDATNVISPEVCGITRIGLEHTAYLGRTIREIAREKAGIIKEGVPVVSCERNPEALAVISAVCERKGAELKLIDRDFAALNPDTSVEGSSFDYRGASNREGLRIRLVGSHQIENAAMAVAMAEALRGRGFDIPDDSIAKGLAGLSWQGRLEFLEREPVLVLDGSHNPEGVSTTVEVLRNLGLIPLTYVIAFMNDKDAGGMVRALAPTASKIVVTEVDIARSMRAGDLAALVRDNFNGPVEQVEDSAEAMEQAVRGAEGRGVCIIGSFYLAGDALKWHRKQRSSTEGPSTRKV